jgi:hypothetical protein
VQRKRALWRWPRPVDGRSPAGRRPVQVSANRATGTAPQPVATAAHDRKEMNDMGYGIGGVLVLILVILAIIYFAKRV